MGLCASVEVPDIEVEAPNVDVKKAMADVKKSMGAIEKSKDAEKKGLKYPFTLHEFNDKEKQKITELPKEDEKWADKVYEYLAACDEKVIKSVADTVWKNAALPALEPAVDKSIAEATGNVEGWDKLPGFIKTKAKKTAKKKALEQARKKSKFDARVQVKAFSIIIEGMTKAGATIEPDYKPTEVE
ncbi:hypothetical protein AAMO2058_000114200 [Amorphochlora amoebiformis]